MKGTGTGMVMVMGASCGREGASGEREINNEVYTTVHTRLVVNTWDTYDQQLFSPGSTGLALDFW